VRNPHAWLYQSGEHGEVETDYIVCNHCQTNVADTGDREDAFLCSQCGELMCPACWDTYHQPGEGYRVCRTHMQTMEEVENNWHRQQMFDR